MPDRRRDEPQLSALPSARARALAFLAILGAGACGGLIGWSVTTLQCRGSCSTAGALGGLVGALVAAGGVAVVAVLALRAMGEWKRIRQAELSGEDVAPVTTASGPGPDPGPSSPAQ